MSKFLTEYMLIFRCAAQSCSKEITKTTRNKKLTDQYTKFKLEQDNSAKLKILLELSENNIMYDVNSCVIKNCKKFVNDIIKTFKSYLTIISKTNPKHNILENIIFEIESLIDTTALTKKQYTLKIKKINSLISTL